MEMEQEDEEEEEEAEEGGGRGRRGRRRRKTHAVLGLWADPTQLQKEPVNLNLVQIIQTESQKENKTIRHQNFGTVLNSLRDDDWYFSLKNEKKYHAIQISENPKQDQ